jgi:predicted nucleotidyltransferase
MMRARSAFSIFLESKFGSVARGTPLIDSDIDLLVEIDKEDFRLRRELIGLAFDILLSKGLYHSGQA